MDNSLESKIENLEKRVSLLESFVKNQLQINHILRGLVINKYEEGELEEYLNKKKEELSNKK